MADFRADIGIRKASLKAEVEVLLLERDAHNLLIQEDETRPPRSIPKVGISVSNVRGNLAILSMTERRAVNLNLI